MAITYASSKNVTYGQRSGNDLVKLLPETSAAQVKMADGSTVETRVTSLSATVAGQTVCRVVADIAARDALTGMNVGDQCWVRDATGDATVTGGAAKYIYESAETGWGKTAEAESMDVVVDWGDVRNKPASAAADIDDAVSKRHEHANKADLDKLSVSAGQVAVDGTVMKSVVYASALPATMPADLVEGGLLVVDTAVGA